MTDTHHVNHGADLDAFEAFAEHATQNPETVQFELGAHSTDEGTCAHSLAKIDSYELGGQPIERDTREYTIPYGGWREVLDAASWVGATDRMEPIGVALSALASCINVGISVNALAAGVDIRDPQTRVTADFDPAVLFGLKDHDASASVFQNVEAEVEVVGDDLDDDLVDEWARRAPVYALVALAQDIDISVDRQVAAPEASN